MTDWEKVKTMPKSEPEGPLAMFHRLINEGSIKRTALRKQHPKADHVARVFAEAAPANGVVVVEASAPGQVLLIETVLFSPNYYPDNVCAFDMYGAPVRVERYEGWSPTRFVVAPGAVRFEIQTRREVRGMVTGWSWPAE